MKRGDRVQVINDVSEYESFAGAKGRVTKKSPESCPTVWVSIPKRGTILVDKSDLVDLGRSVE